MNRIILDRIEVSGNRVDYYFSPSGNLQKYFKAANHLFLEYNYQITDIPRSILTIPFVANVIPLIWITGSEIMVDELDKDFLEGLNPIRAAFQNMFPNVSFDGKVTVGSIIDNPYTYEHEAAGLFSGGLDALTTFIRIKEKNPFLITEYGWHDNDIRRSDVWEADKAGAISFAEQYGLENILIQSNYGTFIHADNINYDYQKKLEDTWWHGLHHGLAIISAAIPIAYKLKIEYIYIASSNSPLYQTPCASDPTVDNEIRYGSGKVFHDGYELTRQDKVKVVVDHYSVSKEKVSIRVCFRNEENCCNCEKCLRTILGIIAEGHDPRNYGFHIPQPFSAHLKNFLDKEVKSLTPMFIAIYWKVVQQRMRENKEKIIYRDLLDWFIQYDFAKERKKALLKYRITKIVPIMKRRITTQINRMIANSK